MKISYLILAALVAGSAAAIIFPGQFSKSYRSKPNDDTLVMKSKHQTIKITAIRYQNEAGYDPIDQYPKQSHQYLMIMLFRDKLKDSKRIYVMDRLAIDNAYYNEYLFPSHKEGKTDLLCESAWMEQNNIIATDTEQGSEYCAFWNRFLYDMQHGYNMDKKPAFVIVNSIKDWEIIFPNERKRW